jgi:hypothetical protein
VNLADLIDLEAQLARDRDADPAALEARDRALVGRAGAPARPATLLRRWLDALHEAEPGRGRPGRQVASALAATRAALVFLGLALGWGAATAAVRFSGGHPVNVWDFLLAFVGLQLALLVLLAVSFFVPLAAAGRPVAGLVRGAVGAILARAATRTGPGARAHPDELRALWHRLRSRRSLYHHVEPWLLLGTTQGFGVAFNVGALAALLRLVVFTDLAFGWSTTLVDLDAGRFHALASALAAPWRSLWPEAVPSPGLVAATRYSHLTGEYVAGAASPVDAGGWWPFLAAALATYGLLPRLLLLLLARLRAGHLLRRLPLDDAEVTRVVRRLAEPHVETRGRPDPADVVAAPDAPAPAPAPAAAGGTRCAVVVWRDAPLGPAVRAAVERRAGCAVAALHPAGGVDDPEDGPLPALDGADPVVVVAESWESPDKATLRFLRGVRAAIGPRRHLLVLLLESASPGEIPALKVWRERLAALEDPWLEVEPLGRPA